MLINFFSSVFLTPLGIRPLITASRRATLQQIEGVHGAAGAASALKERDGRLVRRDGRGHALPDNALLHNGGTPARSPAGDRGGAVQYHGGRGHGSLTCSGVVVRFGGWFSCAHGAGLEEEAVVGVVHLALAFDVGVDLEG